MSLKQKTKLSKKNVIINYVSTMSLLVLGYIFYSYCPFISKERILKIAFLNINGHTIDIFLILLSIYAVGLLPIYYFLPPHILSKSTLFWKCILKSERNKLSPIEINAVLSICVKFFFLPIMILFFVSNLQHLISYWEFSLNNTSFFKSFYFICFYWLITVDVTCFILGYATEHPKLKNEIFSVDKTLTGWFLCLICYPPFNLLPLKIFGWYSVNFPDVKNFESTVALSIAALFFLFVYVWASVSLNFKASNLTNRGIISKGPYALVRHPAYSCKVLMWWVGSFPIIINEFHYGLLNLFFCILSLSIWSAIYWGRALTEEIHLSQDPTYLSYLKKVKYRFICDQGFNFTQ